MGGRTFHGGYDNEQRHGRGMGYMWRKQCRKIMASPMWSKYSMHNEADYEIRVGGGDS